MAPVEGHTQFALLLQSCNLVAIVVHANKVAMRPPWDAARYKAPARTPPFPSMRTGTLKPKAKMLSAMRATWRGT